MKPRFNRFVYEYREEPDPVRGLDESLEEQAKSQQEFVTYTYGGEVNESRRILQRIHDAIDDREEQSSGVFNRVVILGVEDYLAADAWLRYDSNGSTTLESHLSVDVVVIPGRMIHIPKTNQRALIDHLKEIHSDENMGGGR